jgi:hypothetical protein
MTLVGPSLSYGPLLNSASCPSTVLLNRHEILVRTAIGSVAGRPRQRSLLDPLEGPLVCSPFAFSSCSSSSACCWSIHFRGPISHERAPTRPCRFLYVQALFLGFCIQETAWPGGCALMRYAPPKCVCLFPSRLSRTIFWEANRFRSKHLCCFLPFDRRQSTEIPWTFTGLSGVSFTQVFEKDVSFEPVQKN